MSLLLLPPYLPTTFLSSLTCRQPPQPYHCCHRHLTCRLPTSPSSFVAPSSFPIAAAAHPYHRVAPIFLSSLSLVDASNLVVAKSHYVYDICP
ncbi:hypothetical protein GW17_00020459 [Ensete ventricosum]|nr:hypothetical protein GW17_00020459 [Ensete ventricosum]